LSTVVIKPAGSDSPIEVQLARGDARAPGTYTFQRGELRKEIHVEELSPGAGWLRIGGAVVPFYYARMNDAIRVWVQGRTYDFEIAQRTARRTGDVGRAGPVKTTLTAPMPGTILRINVARGNAFAAHQPLVIMESMKMEMTLSVPHAGRIGEITCKVGQLVEMGALLARLEAPDEKAP
jgi:biotin carboxyl carrier protein